MWGVNACWDSSEVDHDDDASHDSTACYGIPHSQELAMRTTRDEHDDRLHDTASPSTRSWLCRRIGAWFPTWTSCGCSYYCCCCCCCRGGNESVYEKKNLVPIHELNPNGKTKSNKNTHTPETSAISETSLQLQEHDDESSSYLFIFFLFTTAATSSSSFFRDCWSCHHM